MDNKYFKELLQLDLQVLEIGKIELKNERSFLEKRIGCIVGSLDKLGILPGVLSTMAILSTSGGFNWVSGIAYAYIILMLISFTFYPMIMRYNRMIELTELVIQFKNEQLK
ncbi:hypothetical protein A9G23_09470 [Gilliamella sp. App4-10]|nr:hypothetical protein A9G23_09470 [Gilliamella apicola]